MSEFSATLDRIIAVQRAALAKDGIPSEDVRIDRLARVAKLISENREEISDALSRDFGYRADTHTLIELSSTINAMTFSAKHVGEWMKPDHREALAADARAVVEYTPKGVIGIMGPWNVPFYLIMIPLAGVLAAGNRAVIKPSEFTPIAAELMQRLVAQYFSEDEVTVVLGGATEGAEFASAAFDHIMFTGSTNVGRHVMRAASANLVPVTLELGGKCPTIVTESFNIDRAAERIMAVKAYNSGQICVAPDHVYVPESRKQEFINACLTATKTMYPEGIGSPDYTSMINSHHYQRMADMVQDARDKGATVIDAIASEGKRHERQFPLTLVLDPGDDAQVMNEEIFGPILPIFGYTAIDDVLTAIATRDHPLGLFIFSDHDSEIRYILDHSVSGGVTVNDVMAHIYPDDLPFGGIGPSGMGRYHSKYGFEEFSNVRSVYYQTESEEQIAAVRAPYSSEVRQFWLTPFDA
ncbi:coniferyl aldehyde dehydrogenase [Mycobacterium paraterrae]|uniref:Aldehyde dehydrogenase n=1 Tax=Mycobacterium paraterrae TaxID=577492 RepID=A0ABY3VK00_9MYCO|nr:coniferyl aldehyde dehydrogenase [Mycobacterium paraterrae]UMB69730.1 coniferyl aldehyde dehydrogenase [Mycobacterium paraterrae]